MTKYKVWLEISKSAIEKNIQTFRRLIGKKTKLFAVVKSNAYGHGLVTFSAIVDKADVDGFCVDSVIEGVTLRKNGITKPVLVLGYTLPYLYKIAADNDIVITISSSESLRTWVRSKAKPQFHLKIDTGMHRQGFYPNDLRHIIEKFKIYDLKFKNKIIGVYTHFAAAKDIKNQEFTKEQNQEFKRSLSIFDEFHSLKMLGLIRHTSATGGALLGKEFHYDAVRVGIGLYGLWPSEELERQLKKEVHLVPVLRWRSIISEIKIVPKGAGIGYDITEFMSRPTRVAIVPVGYWHGLPRAASSIGMVCIGKYTARILGRVSMDMIAIDVTNISCRVGTVVDLSPLLLARTLKASPYEVITRINPLIFKKVL